MRFFIERLYFPDVQRRRGVIVFQANLVEGGDVRVARVQIPFVTK